MINVKRKNKKILQQRGITLVALVISIILLLILAGISIQAITNQGLFGRANEAKRDSEIASIKEQIALDIYEKQLEPPLGSITDEQLEIILGKYGTVNKEDGTIVGITTEKGYEILLKDIYGGETVAESVPDGATVTPVNDITTWLKTGEISKQYSYTTIEQVIADSTCTESLMKNENAMKYLARSTEFANAICASETTMTYLGKSAHVDNTVLNSDIWVSKISSSNYYELVYSPIVVHSSVSATISFNGKSFTSDSSGNTSKVIPWGTYTFSDSVSGQSFERTIDKNTTDLYVMPEGALYWYGNECKWITGGWIKNNGSNVQKYTHYIYAYRDSTSSSIYEQITTNNEIELNNYNKGYASMRGVTSGGETSIGITNTKLSVPISSSLPSSYTKVSGDIIDNSTNNKFGFVVGRLGPGYSSEGYLQYFYLDTN